jgi:hypothetical protein
VWRGGEGGEVNQPKRDECFPIRGIAHLFFIEIAEESLLLVTDTLSVLPPKAAINIGSLFLFCQILPLILFSYYFIFFTFFA